MTDQERIEELERKVKELEEAGKEPDWKEALEDIKKALPPQPTFVPVPYYVPYYYPHWPQPYWITYTSGNVVPINAVP